jgi:hypothetical protein
MKSKPVQEPEQVAESARALGSAMGELWKSVAGLKLPIDSFSSLQTDYVKQATELWNQSLLRSQPDTRETAPAAIGDKRFAAPEWANDPTAAYTAQMYLLNARTLLQLAEAIEGDAMSPANYLALNPEAQKKALQTKGQSVAQGMRHLWDDLRKGTVSQTDETVFEVGRNVATSAGSVVFENELFQLIEYKPLTAKVHRRPMLFVPPCINKYYILDLQPDNSLIRYTAEQGHRMFVMSWRNPDQSLAHLTWDDYIEQGPLVAMRVVREITGCDDLNVLGFCVGRARRAAGALADAADLAAGLHRDRRARRVHRRAERADARGHHRRAGAQRPRLAQGRGARHHLQLPAAERPGVELRGRQLPQGRGAAAVRPAVLERRQHQPAGPDALLLPAPHVPAERAARAGQAHGVRPEG